MNINDVIQKGREVLISAGIEPREARLLLSYVLKVKAEGLIKYKTCTEEQYNTFMELINRRVSGEPYAYIVGHKEFMKLDFKVNKNVLIPREDTEILVQEVINYVENMHNLQTQSINILDMCTGGGCIAISLNKYIKNSNVVAVDISEDALKIARENNKQNNTNVQFIKSDLFDDLHNITIQAKLFANMHIINSNNELLEKNIINKKIKFDIIVSNPPYIKSDIIDTLQKEVQNEPKIALDGGYTGLDFYERITEQAKDFLKENGALFFEIGFDEAESVENILKKNNFKNISIIKDLSDNDRVVLGQIN